MARPTSCVPDAGRAADPALTLLLTVLQSVQGAARTLESNVQVEEKMHLSILRIIAFSTWEVMSPLASAGLDDEIASHTEAVFEAVEVAFDVKCDHDEFDCPIWKKSLGRHYPNCHALCHLSTTKGFVSICDPHARSILVEKITETFNAFENHRAEQTELAGPTKKQPRASQWEIARSMSQAFHAMSKCRETMADCDVRDKLEARLALATYWNLEDDGYHTIDMLFALGHQTPQWDEVRIHMNSDALVPQKQKRSVVRFAEPGCPSPAASSAYTWRKPVPVKVQHFCSLLEAKRARINARMAINLTLTTENGVLEHKPTKRIANSADLSHSISLADILSSNEGSLCQMAKLLLSVTLGYALFYLYGTPWLTSEGKSVQWDHENIMFFAKDNRLLLRPYIRYKLGRDQYQESDDDCEDMGSIHPYPTLVSFAITLLEIHLGHSLQSHLGDVPMETEDDKWASAQEVFEEQKEFIPWPNYRNAIETCLDPDFVDSEMEADYNCDNIEDDSNGADDGGAHLKHLRTLIYQIIVCPIYDELDRAYGEFINHHDIDKHAAEMDLFHGSSVTTSSTQPESQNQMVVAAPAPRHPTLKEGVSMFKAMKSSMKMDMKMDMKSQFMSAVTVSPIMAKIPLEPRINVPQSLPIMLKNGALKDKPVNEGFYTVFGSSRASNPGENSLTDGWFKQYEELNSLEPLKEIEPGNSERVRVAIIDTGINMGHPDIRAAEESGVIIKVCDFVDGKEGVPNRNAGDSCGHGTHVASIILGMAPNVDLYIARVTEGPKMSGTQGDSIARAINTAVNVWNCSIINLSLGFNSTIPSIDEDLKKALDANVLVFASASNEGGNRGITYPAWCPRVFCIHSTDSYGNPSKFNPTPDDPNSSGDRFSILGESIKGVWPLSTDEDPLWPRQSGTSFAAPVAASLAACLLGVASQWQIQSAVQLASYDVTTIRRTGSLDADGHSLLIKFALDTNGTLWDEVRLHMERLSRPDQVQAWRTARPRETSHFCDLLKEDPDDDAQKEKKSNITINRDGVALRHLPTDRALPRDKTERSVTLPQLLANTENDEFYMMPKLALAVTLAYSLFYLYGGPWLGGEVRLRPFLDTTFRDKSSNTSPGDAELLHPYPPTVDFAITLIEIYLGKTLKHACGSKIQLNTASSCWVYASKVLETHRQSFPGLKSCKVIEACLHPDFDILNKGDGGWNGDEDDDGRYESDTESDSSFGDQSDSANFDDLWEQAHESKQKQKHLRRAIFYKVVRPLHDELMHAFGADISDIDKNLSTHCGVRGVQL